MQHKFYVSSNQLKTQIELHEKQSYDNIKSQDKIKKMCKNNKKRTRSDKCITLGCTTQATYNIEGKRASYCASHKKSDMIDTRNKHCKTPLCYTRVNKKYDGYCLFCFIHMFPDSQITKNHKTKEKEVSDFITKTFPHHKWIIDKKIQDGCSKRRPDFLLDLGEQILIIEIDENQHNNYDCSCENKRLMEISKDLGHRPIIFIRFNPDGYKIGETKIQSCFGYNMKGLCVLKPECIKEWSERLNILKQNIDYWINPLNKTNKTIEIIQLYYDDFEIPNNIVDKSHCKKSLLLRMMTINNIKP